MIAVALVAAAAAGAAYGGLRLLVVAWGRPVRNWAGDFQPKWAVEQTARIVGGCLLIGAAVAAVVTAVRW